MKIKNLLVIFILFLLIDLLIKYISPHFIQFYSRFSYLYSNLPKTLQSYGNFDGVHYINIAKLGYTNLDFVFLPLYPILIFSLTFVTKNFLVSGVIVSAICFFIGLIFLVRLVHLLKLAQINISWLLIFIFLFPTSFFFTSVYSEGLFFLLCVSFFYFLFKKKYLLTAVFGFLAPLTKLIGVFLIIPYFVYTYLPNLKINLAHLKKTLADPLKIIALISPIIGLSVYSLYLFYSHKDPLSFINLHSSFGANRSNHIILLPQIYFRYLKIFFTATFNLQYFIALVEFSFFNFALIVLILDLINILKSKLSFRAERSNLVDMRFALNLFSFIVIIIPTLTGTFLSVPRFIVMALSLYLYLAETKNKSIKIALNFVFFIFHIVLLVLFTQGYFVA